MDVWWPSTVEHLIAEQNRLATLVDEPWHPGRRVRVAAAFVAFLRGEQGPGHAGDRAWVGAVLTDGTRVLRRTVVPGVAGAPYAAGLLALREAAMLQRALQPLAGDADVLMLDASGRDHPRRAGLAVHMGERLGVPSIGVTHRPLLARGPEPGDETGSTAALLLDGDEVARWVRTARGVRPVVAHAGWRTDPRTAARLVMLCSAGSRTPEPLRQARRVARERRSAAERLEDGTDVLGHP